MIGRIIRVLRGGSWYLNPGNLRASLRGGLEPGYRDDSYGFRLVIVEKEG